jgi:hypothetical protein
MIKCLKKIISIVYLLCVIKIDRIKSFLYAIFFTHFEIIKEEYLDDYIFTEEHLNQRYYAEDFEGTYDDTLNCSNCFNDFVFKKECRKVTEQYGNLGIDVEIKANCSFCKHLNHNHIRFKRGYMMKKEGNDWICVVPKVSLIKQFLYTLGFNKN